MSPADHLCPDASRRGSARSSTPRDCDRRRADIDADVDHMHATGARSARFEEQSRLQRGEADGRVGVHRVAAHFARRAVDTRWDVDGEAGHRGRTRGGRNDRGRPVERAAEAGAVHRVDEQIGARERAVEHRRVEGVVEREHVDPDAMPPQHPGRDDPVGTVVPLAAHDDDPPAVRAAEQGARRGRDRAPGPVDEDRFGGAAGDGAAIGVGHLARRENGEHDLHSGRWRPRP